MISPDAIATFRERLLGLRAALLQQLAEADHLDAGLLRALADVETVLAAVLPA